MDRKQESTPITCSEAGKRGGVATSRKYGRKHYQKIGHLGGTRLGELLQKARELEAQGK